MVDVTGLRQTHDRMDQEIRGRFPRRPKGQFLMRAVQRIAGLECNDAVPAKLAKICAKFVWRVPANPEVVMCGKLETGHWPAQIDRAGRVVQIVDARMCKVFGAKDFLRFP